MGLPRRYCAFPRQSRICLHGLTHVSYLDLLHQAKFWNQGHIYSLCLNAVAVHLTGSATDILKSLYKVADQLDKRSVLLLGKSTLGYIRNHVTD